MRDQLLSRRVTVLEKLFDVINAKLFANELQPVVITISPDTTKGAYGWFTVGKRWSTGTDDDAKRYHEINISAEYCNRPIKAIAETLIHEMVHLYCSQNGIKDTSNRGNYHNTRFASACETHGLHTTKTRYGYSKTFLQDSTSEWLDSLQLKDLDLFRISGKKERGTEDEGGETKPRVRWFKLVCPVCGEVIKVKKLGKFYCANSHEPVEMMFTDK